MDKHKRIANLEGTVNFPNIDDWNEDFWKQNYLILISGQSIAFAVNADSTQDAFDYIIDYCQEHMPGLVLTHEEAHELARESMQDYGDERYVDELICGGNEGLHLSSQNTYVEKL